ncbi:MAG: putative LPS assembly protein LptD [bacterium]
MPGLPTLRLRRALLVWFITVVAATVVAGCASTAPRDTQAAAPAIPTPDSLQSVTGASGGQILAGAGGLIASPFSHGMSTDSLAANVHEKRFAAPDTLHPDSLRRLSEGMGLPMSLDSVRSALLEKPAPPAPDSTEEESGDLDTSIVYGGKELYFDVQRRISIIRGNAKIVYKDMTLTANEILVDWEDDLMTAIPLLDTLWTDSTHSEIDSISTIGLPTFVQHNQNMSGMLMRVNMKNRAGYVEGGMTQYGDGFYRGDRIQKVSDDVFFVQGGVYTSCDAPEPHYKFTGSEMKMIRGDKVVGKPIVLRFGDVPVAALPFAVFSIKSGRHSGILIPTYGDDSNRGRRFENLGYYWEASDYWDIKGVVDYFEESGFRLRSDLVYNKRYAFAGGTSASYKNEHNNKVYWDLRTRHRQTVDENTSLNVDGTFVSDNDFYKTQSQTADQQLKQQITSNATFTHRWPYSGASLSLNLNQSRNLRTGENSMTLPSFNLGFGSKQLFPTAEKRRSSDKTLIYQPPQPRVEPGQERPKDNERWYNTITYSYRVNGSYKQDEQLVDRNNLDTSLVRNFDQAITNNLSFSAPQRVFNYITVSPSLSYKEDWLFRRYNTDIDHYGTVTKTEERGFYRRFSYGTGVNVSTKLYGMFPVQKWGVEMLRHVLTPSVGFSYRPDFSDPSWGYYQHLSKVYFDTTDFTHKTYDRDFDLYTNRIAGNTPSGKQMAANFSLDNLFQMKTLTVDAQGKEQEKKLDLFKINMSSSYNFAADSMNFSDLRSSFRANPIGGNSKIGPLKSLSIDVSTTHSFYAFDYAHNRISSTYYWDRPGGNAGEFLRLTNLSSSASFSLDVQNPFVTRKTRIIVESAPEDTVDQDQQLLEDIRNEFDTRFSSPDQVLQSVSKGGTLQIRGSLTYQLSRTNPLNENETIFLRGSFSLKLTRNWTFNYSTGVDLMTRQVSVGTLSVGRDLHCWSGTFTWSPTGIGQGFFLRIGIKTPQLSDVKLEQRRGISGPSF